MKRHSLLESLKRLAPELPRLHSAGTGSWAPVQFSSSGGGGGRHDDPEDDYFDEVPDEESRAPRGERRDEPQATAARRRTVQSEPDDRYWTDYLRIALPVIGLLLVIAVFWYWAQQLIDDDTNGDLTATEPAGIAEVVETETTEPTSASTPDTTQPSEQQGEQAVPPTTAPAENQQSQTEPSPTPSPPPEEPAVADEGTDNQVIDALTGLSEAENAADTGAIQPDTTVTVTDDGAGLALRSEASTAGGEETVVTRLDPGTELTVVDGPTEAEGSVWWEVITVETGEQGFVVEEFIQPAS